MPEPTGSWIEQLRRAREAKGLSLPDIADVTLINVKYLEQIDQGNTTMLPQTYIRAFIREYAAVVGLDPDAIINLYDRESIAPVSSTPVPSRTPGANSSAPPVAWLRWVFSAVAVLGVIIILWASLTREASPPVQEIPFQSVLSENERRLSPTPAPVIQPEPSTSTSAPIPPGDSLTLRASITDSVWLQIVVDDQPPREYLFRPGARASWKGAQSFTLTLGNAGAASFTLNTTPLGNLGKPGGVVRNVRLSRESLTPR